MTATRVRTVVSVVVVLILAGVAVWFVERALRPPGPRPAFQLPVACGETWRLSTYPGHGDYDVDLYPTSGETWGRPVLAAYAGTVVRAGVNGRLGERTPDNPKGPIGRGGGYWVRIDHGGKWSTLYLHLLEPPTVTEGQRVEMGDQLGKLGSTGESSAPHLHFEQLRDGEKVESFFAGERSGITHDNEEYAVNHTSANCP
ncbi:murein DD-endopeptidase MepM/ murein hydrolase activator NlpD [Catenuloplanes nepalensis]|uniref:Murein DD-endopeptidase MepM/ murein hydrolase activator NlpD n=1 Tax=Catenuloplanes nepalensis TaxID=587533 RepID=A0ABT9MRM2_9ACTN|nr:M23 family metallopeptidase [Catenuloplanes nepalensis]MDP9794038.1 murein DD-endopeptidase MepM/ murein hydrolase activator NlpD [Catenuloplanes nepalensis]